MYNYAINNIQQVGNKMFVSVPLSILAIDPTYQRVETSKIASLVRNWDENKMDALRVSLHPEEQLMYIIDGFHRFMAAKEMGKKYLEVEIVKFPDEVMNNPKLRRIAEAKLFAQQNDQVEMLKPNQTHNANVLIGVRENVFLNEMLKKYGLEISTRGSNKCGVITGYTVSLKLIRKDETVYDDTLYVLTEAGWHYNRNGLNMRALRTVYTLIALHKNNRELLKRSLINVLRETTPALLYGCGIAKYPLRNSTEQGILYLEDLVHDATGIEYKYLMDNPYVVAQREAS